ncbi:cache domain-containing protein [Cronbergia sp. UHCC 0137]|uniref:sensor histidine kinase n=1 Tax=Cronbergia sp. UHCC 0137 TaxID=3110239 RepID=UPI002B20E313|nr:cache domain-containing protein [Cronbergia sp. UHCC 0137]MEA5616940.1 cache domain-containing protein [Cronbergia sp. UHCC 0137]
MVGNKVYTRDMFFPIAFKLQFKFIKQLLKLSVGNKIYRKWINLSFRTKLFILLFSGAALPTILATQVILGVARVHLINSQQELLQKDLVYLQQKFKSITESYQGQAQVLQKFVEGAEIDLSDQQEVTQKQKVLKKLVNGRINSEFEPSFYIITDAEGRTVAQNIQTIIRDEKSDRLPVSRSSSVNKYQRVSVPLGINLNQLPIVKNALAEQQMLWGSEVITGDLLQQLGLASQGQIGQRFQQTQNLPTSKLPFPPGTYNIDHGRIGLAIIAVQPIKQNNRLVGLAIAGNLLNRNYQLVDLITQTSGVSTATLFAYDWRVSTNVPNSDQTTRAIGTRVSREVANAVLNQGKKFFGSTNIVGENYITAYAPMYDHRMLLSGQKAKPIGIFYVGEPEFKINKTLTKIAITGYGIGAGILCLAGFVTLLISKAFSQSIQRLTNFAQRLGSGEKGIRLWKTEERQDEIGILEHEFNNMAMRIENNLEKVMENEIQIRQQAQELTHTLEQLKQTQAELVNQARISSLEQLVAGMAHEINNPVNFIYANIIYAEEYIQALINLIQIYQVHYPYPHEEINKILKEIEWEFIESDLPNLLQSIKIGAERITQIVKALRIFSHIDEAEYKQVNLYQGIDSILEIIQYRLRSTSRYPGIEIIKKYGIMPLINCYPGLINQVFFNIINNAIDAIEERYKISGLESENSLSPQICIQTELIDSDWVKIRIIDTGLGISEDIKERLFDPFFTTKTIGKGMGMGLAISYQIVTQTHGGSLECISSVGQGTEFVMMIPVDVKAVRDNRLK